MANYAMRACDLTMALQGKVVQADGAKVPVVIPEGVDGERQRVLLDLSPEGRKELEKLQGEIDKKVAAAYAPLLAILHKRAEVNGNRGKKPKPAENASAHQDNDGHLG